MSEVIFCGEIDFSDAAKVIEFDIIGRELSCYFYAVDQAPPSGLGKLREFYDIWKNAGINGLPAWKDFSFEQFAGWHSVMRVMDTGGSYKAEKTSVIMGETFGSYWGTKTFKAQVEEGTITDKGIINSYEEYHDLMHNGYYVFNVGKFQSENSGIRSMIMIDLPLSEDGENVSHIIGAFVKCE